MKIVIDTKKIIDFILRRHPNEDLPISQYGDFPPIPEEIELKGLRNNFDSFGEYVIKKLEFFNSINPASKILDIGCGNGRVSMPMAKYLHEDTEYFGMDISKERIDWLKENVTSRYPNIKFVYTDLYNKMYNIDGKIKAKDYRFPFEDNSFDLVLLFSVFTHMLPEDVENYMKEVYRVLKKGGKCWITYFLINPYAKELIDEGSCRRRFTHEEGIYMTSSKDRHESMVGYKENYIYDLYKKVGFKDLWVKYGQWREADFKGNSKISQDVITAEK